MPLRHKGRGHAWSRSQRGCRTCPEVHPQESLSLTVSRESPRLCHQPELTETLCDSASYGSKDQEAPLWGQVVVPQWNS